MLTEPVILAICETIRLALEVTKIAMEGQTAEQRAKLWQWYIDDMSAWRKFWGLSA